MHGRKLCSSFRLSGGVHAPRGPQRREELRSGCRVGETLRGLFCTNTGRRLWMP